MRIFLGVLIEECVFAEAVLAQSSGLQSDEFFGVLGLITIVLFVVAAAYVKSNSQPVGTESTPRPEASAAQAPTAVGQKKVVDASVARTAEEQQVFLASAVSNPPPLAPSADNDALKDGNTKSAYESSSPGAVPDSIREC